jgi:hypothetical protein
MVKTMIRPEDGTDLKSNNYMTSTFATASASF